MRIRKLFACLAVTVAGCAAPPARPPAAAVASPVAPPSPAAASRGTLADFQLVLRDALQRRDLVTLRQLMAPDFSSAFTGPSTPEIAFTAWRSENYRALDEALRLLDGGLVPLRENLWVAPSEYRTQVGYRGLRLGIGRRSDGRLEWLFLVRGEG